MPLGFERLNERRQRPNELINFIKPLETKDKAIAEEFLSRIAAQCYPVMKRHHLVVQALEEYAPNPEFLGRNFNAGEVIQLVLKDKQGRWLSPKFVQMVMMHELAHCKQMNHSKFFWAVRNEYAKHMEDLWKDDYSGEGMWGRGRGLANGAFVHAAPPDNTQIPEHLCGGSYRRRGRKRKRGAHDGEDRAKLSYAERQQQRIQRKFGKHGDGEALGDDELTRGALERMNGGKRAQGKPKVAKSKRGRELRANAALARLDALKKQQGSEKTPELVDDEDSQSESDWEAGAAPSSGRKAVVITDGSGRDLVKVCGDGEDDEDGAGKEMDELMLLSAGGSSKAAGHVPIKGQSGYEDSSTDSEPDDDSIQSTVGPVSAPQKAGTRERLSGPSGLHKTRKPPGNDDRTQASVEPIEIHDDTEDDDDDEATAPAQDGPVSADEIDPDQNPVSNNATTPSDHPVQTITRAATPNSPRIFACPVCSLENDPDTPTCMACANVLRPQLMPNHWRCRSDACQGTRYINPGDAGRCGLCQAKKPGSSTASSSSSSSSSSAAGRAMGVTNSEILRWD
jgi:hypothetical protein